MRTTGTPLAFAVAQVVDKAQPSRTHVDLEDVESGGSGVWKSQDASDRLGEALRVEPGDVLFGRLRPYLRKSLLAPEGLTASTEFLVLRPRDGYTGRFIAYAVRDPAFADFATAVSTGVKMPRASWETLREYHCLAAPLRRQRLITDFLDRECARLDALISSADELRRTTLASFTNWSSEVFLTGGVQTDRLKFLVEPPQGGAWGEQPGDDEIDGRCVRVADFDREALVARPAATVRSIGAQQLRRLVELPAVRAVAGW